jgi:HEAT repeat protein
VRGNDATLPEGLNETLLFAAMSDEFADRPLVIASLRAADPRSRQLALRAGAARGWLSSLEWRRALDDESAEVRREALFQLARAREDGLDDAVSSMLADGDPLVGESAAFACGERRIGSSLPGLVEMARAHEDARCREAAVAALGALGDERGKDAVIAALDDKPPVRRRAVVALSNFDGDDVDAAIARAGEDRDWQVRAAVDLLQKEPED